jgi:hypothetical protein
MIPNCVIKDLMFRNETGGYPLFKKKIDKRMQCRIEQAKLEIQRRRKGIDDIKEKLTYIKLCFHSVDLDLEQTKFALKLTHFFFSVKLI